MDIFTNGSKIKTFFAMSAMTGCVLMIVFPDIALLSAQKGIALWAASILPALFPFFICANFMNRLGVTQVLPKSAYAFSMSIMSGYPMGAKIVGDMCKGGIVSKTEAMRLMSFCSTSGPTFIVGAVGVGMLGSSQAGIAIAGCHYGGAVLNGVLFTVLLCVFGQRQGVQRSGGNGFFGLCSRRERSGRVGNGVGCRGNGGRDKGFLGLRGKKGRSCRVWDGGGRMEADAVLVSTKDCFSGVRAASDKVHGWGKYHSEKSANVAGNRGRTSGSGSQMGYGVENCGETTMTLFTDSILEALKSMGIILAYIVLFMFITDMVQFSGAMGALSSPVTEATLKGALEMTVGCSAISSLTIDMGTKIIICTGLISFGGLSVIGQSLSMISSCRIHPLYVFAVKITHCVFSLLLAFAATGFMIQ